MENQEKENQKERSKADLPYDINMELFSKMIVALSKVGGKGENIIDLYNSLNVRKQVASKTSTLMKYVSIADSNNRKIWLTQDGMVFANSTEEGRRKIVMKNIPKNYKTMLNWIRNAKDYSMSANDLRNSVIRIFHFDVGKRLLDSMVVAFCNYFSHFKILNYVKGKTSRCSLTQEGLKLLGEDIKQEEIKENSLNPKDNLNINSDKEISILIKSPMGKNIIEANTKEEFNELKENLSKLWDMIDAFWKPVEKEKQTEKKDNKNHTL